MRGCCSRLLIDTGYIGHKYEQHEAERSHRWVDDGRLCCGSITGQRHQTCYCGAGRWTSRFVSAQQIADEASTMAKLGRWESDRALVEEHERQMAASRARLSGAPRFA